MSKSIYIVVLHGFEATQFLRTGLIEALSTAGWKVTIISPNAGEEYFQNEFESRARLKELCSSSKSSLKRAIYKFITFMSYDIDKSAVLKMRWKAQLFKSPLRYSIKWVLQKIAYITRWSKPFLCRIAANDLSRAEKILGGTSQLEQRVLFMGTNSYSLEVLELERYARRSGVQIVRCLLGWDNLFSKVHFGVHPDRLLVWADIHKEQAIRLHGFKAEEVDVVGCLKYGLWQSNRAVTSTREEFCWRFSLQPNKKLIVFGTANNYIYSSNLELLEIIADAIVSQKIHMASNLFVRLHPQSQYVKAKTTYSDDAGKYQQFASRYSFVALNVPQVQSDILPFDVPIQDLYDLAEAMCHADVVINVGSTLTIDAACFDTPVINVVFDILPKPYIFSSERVYEQDHFRYIVDSGGSRLAYDPQELIAAINDYLGHPDRDGEARKYMFRQQCGPSDGIVISRIVACLDRLANGSW